MRLKHIIKRIPYKIIRKITGVDYSVAIGPNKSLLFLIIEMSIYALRNKQWPYREELKYLRRHGHAFFPYEKIKNASCEGCDYDKDLELPFVIHKGKRLYFNGSFTKEKALAQYINYIETENLLEGKYSVKRPHQYLTDEFHVDDGDVLIDVGAAEALLTLDSIDKVSKAYVIEADPGWIKALNATFAPYKDKVEIINKYVSSSDTDKTISLETLLKMSNGKSVFCKMDIEGYEIETLKGASKYLMETNNIKLACCTYHRKDDAVETEQILRKCGFELEFSDGVLFFGLYDKYEPPYFRKGLIRARK